ncbi:hypothetical protein CRENBAI_011781 [Crenichthys baileyi]|uniref:Uncharacterized protein n=1 Tax=Crenichthys baileyi TaxID=28760 RepID=A0AAV9RYC4_9TELE
MSTSSGKRKSWGKPTAAEDASVASNALIDTCHDYAARADTPRLSLMGDENFPPLPVTPEKPPNKKEKKRFSTLDLRITDMERYSRRWNLKLHGVSERVEEKDVRREVIRICQALLPSDAERLPQVIDTMHRVGIKKTNGTRSIILQFSSRMHRAAVWAAAKNYLQNNNLRFTEDLCKADRETRMKLWPFVDEARKAGKAAFLWVVVPSLIKRRFLFQIRMPPVYVPLTLIIRLLLHPFSQFSLSKLFS